MNSKWPVLGLESNAGDNRGRHRPIWETVVGAAFSRRAELGLGGGGKPGAHKTLPSPTP